MNREYKFRAWCKIPYYNLVKGKGWESKELMCEVSSLNIKTNNARVLYTDGLGRNTFSTISLDKSTLMQYTGIKDIHGTEIYEGDICEIDSGELLEVLFLDGCFVGKVQKEDSFVKVFPRIIEVVGNIFENKTIKN